MKTLKKLLLFVVASVLLAGCTSYKNVPYMQNPEVVNIRGEKRNVSICGGPEND